MGLPVAERCAELLELCFVPTTMFYFFYEKEEIIITAITHLNRNPISSLR